jgi:hypothetical protein
MKAMQVQSQVSQRIGARGDSFLDRGRSLGEARLLYEIAAIVPAGFGGRQGPAAHASGPSTLNRMFT